jgi:hypothetical protein
MKNLSREEWFWIVGGSIITAVVFLAVYLVTRDPATSAGAGSAGALASAMAASKKRNERRMDVTLAQLEAERKARGLKSRLGEVKDEMGTATVDGLSDEEKAKLGKDLLGD